MAPKTISAALAAAMLAGLPALGLAQVASPLTGEVATQPAPATTPAEAASDAATEASSNAEAAAETAAEAAQSDAQDAAEAAAEDAAANAEAAAEAAEAAEDAAADTAEAAPTASEEAAISAVTQETGDGEMPVGAYYVREVFTDWTLRCINSGDDLDPCEMYQLLQDDDGSPVAEMTLIPLVDGGQAQVGATIVSPLETDLMFGVGFQIDSGEARRYPFSFCASVGCVARMGFTGAELNAMKRGLIGHVVLLPFGAPESEAFDLELSLQGFTAAYDELEGIVGELRAAAEAEEEAD
ncbi:MAG: invasion associated locus B family protein [Paracoccus sp. (in: a-proteobacteria)]|nr:invasion associated locus B family protein [Paracoccus sp. (in: a-proteobacteria)]